ncbi:hypothetical protein [Nocardia nova]|uniref:hypothetical protein n=1 Tax=Nocardia nova TaxID=37330 RepID=UPI0033CBD257
MSSQTFSPTEYFDRHRRPVLHAAGPVTGHLSVGYRPNPARPGQWTLLATLTPALHDAHGHNTEPAHPITVRGGKQHTGVVELVIEADDATTGTIAACHILSQNSRTTSPGSTPAALRPFLRQLIRHWHTDERLHNAQIHHAKRTITQLEHQLRKAITHHSELLQARTQLDSNQTTSPR